MKKMKQKKRKPNYKHIAELEKELGYSNEDKPCDVRGYHNWIKHENADGSKYWQQCPDCGASTMVEIP
jgi:hypothetical protein